MRQWNRWGAAALFAAALALPACGGSSESASPTEPATVEEIAGSDFSRVTLTAEAAERVGIRTASVRIEDGARTVPYSAVLYDAEGKTYVYVNPSALTFVRAPVAVDTIRKNRAVLAKGPARGTKVVTVGAAELLGAEFGVG